MERPLKIVFATLHAQNSPQAVSLAAGCLAATLPERVRACVRILDFFPGDKSAEATQQIVADSPRVAAFPLYAWNRAAVLDLSRKLKETHPSIYLVAGGPEANTDPEGLLAEGGFDAVFRGEGESSFRELIERLEGGRETAQTPGTTVKTASGPVSGPDRSTPEDLKISPWLTGVLKPSAGVLWETSRGCPFTCDYCYDGRGTQGVRVVPSERLEAELDLFVRSGVAQAWILDSTFNYPPERGKEILRLITRKAPQLHYHLEAKAEFLDQETVHLLSRLRCSVQIGLQSARPEVLRNIHRTLDLSLFSRKIHLLQSEGIVFGFDLIYGLPGDDYAGFRGSLQTALDLAPNHVEIFPLAVLPGTALYRRRDEFGIRAQEHPPYRVLENATCSAAELERCRHLAAAADIFYNIGRAVAFFPALLRATGLAAAEFLEQFSAWACGPGGVGPERCATAEGWNPAEVYDLQERFVTVLLKERGREDLLPAALDLMRFHFHYAETLMGEETVPRRKGRSGRSAWERRWRMAPNARLVSFAYELLDLQEIGEADLEEFTALFRPVGSTALFLRRGDQVICESLEEDFLKLLQGSNGERTPGQIFGGSIGRREGEEIVEFAVDEGFLIPAEKSRR
jgi:tRNA A37 methylthiotransferase MiaB